MKDVRALMYVLSRERLYGQSLPTETHCGDDVLSMSYRLKKDDNFSAGVCAGARGCGRCYDVSYWLEKEALLCGVGSTFHLVRVHDNSLEKQTQDGLRV